MRTTEDPIYGKPPSPFYFYKFIHFFVAKRADRDNVTFLNTYRHAKLLCCLSILAWISVFRAPDGPVIHPRDAERTKILFVQLKRGSFSPRSTSRFTLLATLGLACWRGSAGQRSTYHLKMVARSLSKRGGGLRLRL